MRLKPLPACLCVLCVPRFGACMCGIAALVPCAWNMRRWVVQRQSPTDGGHHPATHTPPITLWLHALPIPGTLRNGTSKHRQVPRKRKVATPSTTTTSLPCMASAAAAGAKIQFIEHSRRTLKTLDDQQAAKRYLAGLQAGTRHVHASTARIKRACRPAVSQPCWSVHGKPSRS